MKLEDIDKNFKVSSSVDREGLDFFSVDEEPFRIYGVKKKDGFYYRLPKEVASGVNEGVAEMCCCTAGGRVRFKTNSRRIAVAVKYDGFVISPHIAITGRTGLDLYVEGDYYGTFIPPREMPTLSFESVLVIQNDEDTEDREREITINFPTYEVMTDLYVGVDEGKRISAPSPYRFEKPVVYYGSSITQGACTSRPGNTYEAMLTRRLDSDHINLGFSGNAKGEAAMAEYIASLDMSVFVCDYDFNALEPQDLEATHYPFYRIVRDKRPELPIIFITRPSKKKLKTITLRREVIKRTYDRAVSEGDKKVYFLNGADFFPFDSNEFTVDNVHPTDLGFYFMANGIYPLLKEILENEKAH